MLITNQQFFKSRHPKTLAYASLAALTIIVLTFLYSPAFRANPYQLSEAPIMRCIPPPEITIPPPPADIPMPRTPVIIEIVEGDGSEPEVAMTNPDFIESPPALALGQEANPHIFVAVDRLPKLLHPAKVVYPEMAREAELEGIVKVVVVVSKRGKVIEATVLSSTVPPILEKAALEAAWWCHFSPGMQRDIPVRTKAVIPFEFRIR